MAKMKKIRFLLCVSLMIFPAHALDVIISGAHENFKQKSEIKTNIINGQKIYGGTLSPLAYEARNGTSKVIVYIISRSRCVEILRSAVRKIRLQIAEELNQWHCELVFLGIENFDDDEYHLISAFMHDKIRSYQNLTKITIETIGENRFDYSYQCHDSSYQEIVQICGATLIARLRAIRHGALRPVENDYIKEIRLLGYQPVLKEVHLSVRVINNTYCPEDDVNGPVYNFRNKYPNRSICLLILNGREYLAVTSYGSRRSQRVAMKKNLNRMLLNKEALIILGVFNFDWTEVYIVTQIILKHSEGLHSSDYNVFTYGYGMFNTYYLNVNFDIDRRFILRQPNSQVTEIINELMGGEVKERAIKVCYYHDEWKNLEMPINLGNGRYIPEVKHNDFIIPCQNQKIAFIVYDSNEVNYQIDYSVVGQSLGELERSDISVVFIGAFNFGFDDIHIIAEWIDRHSGVANLERIAVLGGGIFDTIFQSHRNTYNIFLNTNKNELKTIRNAYVKSGDGKGVFAANIDDGNFDVWSYPMNTLVNGFYEPDLIPDKNIFRIAHEKKIYFIITGAKNFQQIAAIKDVELVASSFRRNISRCYPTTRWRVFLVGLDKFEERDSHLFAELVERQTNVRSVSAFVRVVNYDMSETLYQYKDTEPFDIDNRCSLIAERFASVFQMHTQNFTGHSFSLIPMTDDVP